MKKYTRDFNETTIDRKEIRKHILINSGIKLAVGIATHLLFKSSTSITCGITNFEYDDSFLAILLEDTTLMY